MKVTKEEKQEAIESLKSILTPGQTIYTVLRSVSSSGMTRSISTFTVHEGKIISLDWYLQRALGLSRHRSNNGLVVTGAGMDMGFDLVYRTGRVMFPDGFALPTGKRGRNGDTSGFDTDGGYAFSHSWL